MAIPESTDPKSQLRNTMRRLLRGAPQDSRAVCHELDRWLANRPELQTIAVFSALPGEIDLSELVARHPHRCWVYPRVAGYRLTFHAVRQPSADLAPGAFGIQEPAASLPEIVIAQIDAFLCPGLAFDARGGRLGRGRGFYDRVLAGARSDALKVGVCFASQIVPDTFPESHDVHMDEVVSA